MIPAIENGKLIYRKVISKVEVPIEDVVWAYLQIESGSGHMCCGEFDYKIYRVIIHLASKEVIQFQYEKESIARDVLERLHQASDQICIGFTEENKKRFLEQ